ncbi:hypothetical protein [Olsenella uli]|uniref:hypothetical protein n=1 Tax=Olsenella uli TaxID=133926 RepID=UPI003D7B10DB
MGTVAGYYDPDLTILSVSEPLLRGLGYTLDSFMVLTGGSLWNMFYGEGASFLEPGRFPWISGRGEGRVLTSDGSPVNAELCKKDATDALGKPIWVMSVHLTWEHENLSLINEAISAALWYSSTATRARRRRCRRNAPPRSTAPSPTRTSASTT